MFDADEWKHEQAVSGLTHSQQQRKELPQAELKQQRQDFINALKHKLLTPVLAERRAIGLLSDGAFGAVNDTQLGILKILAANADKVIADIGAMVEIYRYQDGSKKLNIRRRPISWLLHEVVNRASKTLLDINLVLNVSSNDPNCLLDCDPDEILSLLTHLLDNAMRFAKENINLVINTSPDCKNVMFRVEDDGNGMSSQDASQLFDHFHFISSSGQYPAVTGVGLCLCYQIATAHAGTISCTSPPGKGTRFTVALPKKGHQEAAQ